MEKRMFNLPVSSSSSSNELVSCVAVFVFIFIVWFFVVLYSMLLPNTEILHSYIIPLCRGNPPEQLPVQPAEARMGLLPWHTIILQKKNHCTRKLQFGKGWALDMLKVPETRRFLAKQTCAVRGILI
jgi:hypothetical protein